MDFYVHTHTESPASPPISFKEAFIAMLPLASEWQNIAVVLDPALPEGAIETIAADFRKSNDCLREMLKCWLMQSRPCPTWAGLANAVELFNSKKADEIRQKYT